MKTTKFTPYEIGLLQEALNRAASRHESEARFGRTSVEAANRHRSTAQAMIKLFNKIARLKTEAA